MSGPSSNPGDPIAYFITWTTYGTWLWGDERGWMRKGESGVQEPNNWMKEYHQQALKETACKLSELQRESVEQTIRRHCEYRHWTLHAVNVRTNHVHVIVTANEYASTTVRDQLKAWCTRNLKVLEPTRKQFWTEGAFCQSIYTEEDFEGVMLYVVEAQDEKGKEN